MARNKREVMGVDRDVAEFGRFAEPALLILVSLAGGDKHGYAMIEDISSLAGIRLGPGTLYGALARLERSGLIQALPPVERRRPYRLTASGMAALERYLASLEGLVATGLGRLART